MKQNDELPNLDIVLVAFLESVLTGIPGTIPEYAPGGEIDVSTPRKRKRAAIDQTNDSCEGAISVARSSKRLRTTETDYVRNGKMRRNWNGGHTSHQRFKAKHWTPQTGVWVRKTARSANFISEEKAQHMQISLAKSKKADAKNVERARKAERTKARTAETARIQLLAGKAATLDQLAKLSQKDLDAQIDKLRSIDREIIVPKSSFNQDGETKLKGHEKKQRKAQAVYDALRLWATQPKNVVKGAKDQLQDAGMEDVEIAAVSGSAEALGDEEMLFDDEETLL
jgi:hypothetical protein